MGYTETFVGRPVVDWLPGEPIDNPAVHIYRISTDFLGMDDWAQTFHAFLEQPASAQVTGFSVGYWGADTILDDDFNEIVSLLIQAREQLPNLKVLLVNDIGQDEHEMSWISNTDLGALLTAYHDLEHLQIMGGNDLRLTNLHLPHLRTLVIETGGMSAEAVRDVMNAQLPTLEHLELLLGTESYGATSSVDDLAPILSHALFPRLKYLGLKNSDYEDQIAQVLAEAPVLDGLEVLDLSMGALTDAGAMALIGSSKVRHLKKLDIHHHFCSDEMVTQLRGLGIEVDASEQQGDDDFRFVALGE